MSNQPAAFDANSREIHPKVSGSDARAGKRHGAVARSASALGFKLTRLSRGCGVKARRPPQSRRPLTAGLFAFGGPPLRSRGVAEGAREEKGGGGFNAPHIIVPDTATAACRCCYGRMFCILATSADSVCRHFSVAEARISATRPGDSGTRRYLRCRESLRRSPALSPPRRTGGRSCWLG